MERKIAPFFVSLAGGFLLACSPEVSTPTPTPESTSTPVILNQEVFLPLPSPTPRSLVRVRDLQTATLLDLQSKYREGMNIMALCDVLPLTTRQVIGASGSLDWPTYGPISSYFSQWHPGLDITPPYGTPVTAADEGLVLATAQESWGLGWHILLFHGERMTVYAHLSQMAVKLGDQVTKGEQIGKVGSTGRTTGDHLHFEVIQKTENGCKWVNPLSKGILP